MTHDCFEVTLLIKDTEKKKKRKIFFYASKLIRLTFVIYSDFETLLEKE